MYGDYDSDQTQVMIQIKIKGLTMARIQAPTIDLDLEGKMIVITEVPEVTQAQLELTPMRRD